MAAKVCFILFSHLHGYFDNYAHSCFDYENQPGLYYAFFLHQIFCIPKPDACPAVILDWLERYNADRDIYLVCIDDNHRAFQSCA